MSLSGFIYTRQTQTYDPVVRFERFGSGHGFHHRAKQPHPSGMMCRTVLIEYQHGHKTEKVVVA